MSWNITVVGVALVAVAGCRAAARVVEEPRVDLEMPEGANRGYLVGTPPPMAERTKTTRKIVETELEVPALRGRAPAPVSLGEIAPPEVDLSEESPAPEAAGAIATSGTYVVKEGDTLWSIAADPNVLGNSAQWRRLYDANRDVLKSPDRLRPGLTLRIPGGGPSISQEPDEGKGTYTK